MRNLLALTATLGVTALIAGVVIAIEKPFRLNGWIKVGDIEGRIIEDLGSSFGTLVNGKKVDRRSLQPLDRIAIGGTVIAFEADGT